MYYNSQNQWKGQLAYPRATDLWIIRSRTQTKQRNTLEIYCSDLNHKVNQTMISYFHNGLKRLWRQRRIELFTYLLAPYTISLNIDSTTEHTAQVKFEMILLVWFLDTYYLVAQRTSGPVPRTSKKKSEICDHGKPELRNVMQCLFAPEGGMVLWPVDIRCFSQSQPWLSLSNSYNTFYMENPSKDPCPKRLHNLDDIRSKWMGVK
jgi:hypothetical protein